MRTVMLFNVAFGRAKYVCVSDWVVRFKCAVMRTCATLLCSALMSSSELVTTAAPGTDKSEPGAGALADCGAGACERLAWKHHGMASSSASAQQHCLASQVTSSMPYQPARLWLCQVSHRLLHFVVQH